MMTAISLETHSHPSRSHSPQHLKEQRDLPSTQQTEPQISPNCNSPTRAKAHTQPPHIPLIITPRDLIHTHYPIMLGTCPFYKCPHPSHSSFRNPCAQTGRSNGISQTHITTRCKCSKTLGIKAVNLKRRLPLSLYLVSMPRHLYMQPNRKCKMLSIVYRLFIIRS
jgi:hypothetical protein